MRDEVERANQARLRALRGDLTEYIAEDWCVSNQYDSSPEETRKKNTYLQNFMAPQKLQLKIDAQVMLIKNLDTSLVNGTIGKIVGFTAPGLEEDDEDSLNAMETGEYEERIKMKANVAKMVAMGKIELAPVIDWRTPGGIERQTMKREEFKAEDTQGKPQATRKQVRLSYDLLRQERLKLTRRFSFAVPYHSVRCSILSRCSSFRLADHSLFLSSRSAWAMRFAVSLSTSSRRVAESILALQYPQVTRTNPPSRQSRSRQSLRKGCAPLLLFPLPYTSTLTLLTIFHLISSQDKVTSL